MRYIGLDGKVKRTYALFAVRETIRRIYSAIKQRKQDGQVNFHNSTEMFAPVLIWVTSYWDGEHLGVVTMVRGLSKKDPILKRMPLDYFRTEFMGHQWGVPAEFLEYMWKVPQHSFHVAIINIWLGTFLRVSWWIPGRVKAHHI